MNIELAKKILEGLRNHGVQEIVLCSGARNAPFVKLLENPNPFRVHSFFDERAAAFFALGVTKRSGNPCAVITTSGTAVSETLSSVIEAYYTSAPIVIVSADRPKSYRGSCAPQSMDQVGLFGKYAKCFDIDSVEAASFELTERAPTHLNVCFDEPLIDSSDFSFSDQSTKSNRPTENGESPIHSSALNSFLQGKLSPIVVVGGLDHATAARVEAKLNKMEISFFVESISNFRGKGKNQLVHLDKLDGKRIDGVIRIGGVPTSRFWRNLEKNQTPTLNFSDNPFSGLSFVKEKPETINAFLDSDFSEKSWRNQEIIEKDREYDFKLKTLLEKYPDSEPAIVNQLARSTISNHDVMIGNSLPIRYWNLSMSSQSVHYFNRGMNGIDGLIATAIGASHPDRRMWVVLGDLSALYDLNALGSVPLEIQDFKVVVINNGGGMIFNRMFQSALFENRHKIGFSKWAEMFGFAYSNSLNEIDKGRQVIELVPDAIQTKEFLDHWERVGTDGKS